MCAVRKELLADFAELRYAEIECACGTRIAIDLDNRKAINPSGCPACNETFPHLKDGLDSLSDLCRLLGKFDGATVRIRIPLAGDSL